MRSIVLIWPPPVHYRHFNQLPVVEKFNLVVSKDTPGDGSQQDNNWPRSQRTHSQCPIFKTMNELLRNWPKIINQSPSIKLSIPASRPDYYVTRAEPLLRGSNKLDLNWSDIRARASSPWLSIITARACSAPITSPHPMIHFSSQIRAGFLHHVVNSEASECSAVIDELKFYCLGSGMAMAR